MAYGKSGKGYGSRKSNYGYGKIEVKRGRDGWSQLWVGGQMKAQSADHGFIKRQSRKY